MSDNLLLIEKEKFAEKEDTKEIVKKYNKAIFDEESSDPLPYNACPRCGSTNLKRSSADFQGDLALFIECADCGWCESQEM